MAHWDKRSIEAERALWRSSVVRPPLVMERWWELPRKWTFQMPKLRQWIESRLTGEVLNLFGGATRLTHPEGGTVVYNDLNTDLSADYRRDAYDLEQWADCADRFDTVVFDPPYTAFQAVKTYGRKKAQQVSHARDVVEFVLKPGGRVISLGFNSTGMSESRGFVKESIALVNGGGSHNDIILLSERHTPHEQKRRGDLGQDEETPSEE